MSDGLTRAAARLETINRGVGAVVRWAALVMVVVQFGAVLLRYVFGTNSIFVNELVFYFNAALFMLGAGYTLVVDGHVRVDVLRSRFSWAVQRRIEVGGHLLLLLPFALFLLWASWPYAVESWRTGETSVETSGLPFVYLLKSLMPVAAVQLALQALASAWLLARGVEQIAASAHDEGL